MANAQLLTKGWFNTPGRPGDREPADQLKGLDIVDFKDKFVLDLGAAEGAICEHALDRGAKAATAVEIVQAHVDVGRRLYPRVQFVCADLHHWGDREQMAGKQWDVVLMLASLHKLRRPLERLQVFLELASDLVVVRLPPETGPVIMDARSGKVPFDTRKTFWLAGFRLEAEGNFGHFGEYMAYWRRA